MRMLVVAALVALSGCATAGEMAQKAPDQVYQSPKGREAIAECLLDRLSGPDVRPEKRVDANATTVAFTGLGGIAKPGLYYFAIRDAGAGSSIEAHRLGNIDLSSAESCF